MNRKLLPLLAALALAVPATVGLVGTTSAQAEVSAASAVSVRAAAQPSVLPHQGRYVGRDYADRVISLNFHGNQMSKFTINDQLIGGAHVTYGAWHETCHGGMCTRGHWVSDTQVQGAWRPGGGHWTNFFATVATASTRYHGTYSGRDVGGAPVFLRYDGHHVMGLSINGQQQFANAPVSHVGVISETCLNTWCFKGHWQDDYTVAGFWRHGAAGNWHYWEARAFAS